MLVTGVEPIDASSLQEAYSMQEPGHVRTPDSEIRRIDNILGAIS